MYTRVERFWRDVTNRCTFLFNNLFLELEHTHGLNVDNWRDMYLLHKFFLPLINTRLEEFASGWNNHPLSTSRNMTPMQIMISCLPPANVDIELEEMVSYLA